MSSTFYNCREFAMSSSFPNTPFCYNEAYDPFSSGHNNPISYMSMYIHLTLTSQGDN